jgi:hypothetical protein
MDRINTRRAKGTGVGVTVGVRVSVGVDVAVNVAVTVGVRVDRGVAVANPSRLETWQAGNKSNMKIITNLRGIGIGQL